MLRRALILTLLSLLAAQPLHASEKKKPEAGEPGAGQYVDLAVVALPIVIDGRMINYAFVRARINLTPRADASKMRAKEPFFRDALVKAAHRAPLSVPTDHQLIDAAKFKAMLMREAATITGPGIVQSVELTSQSPLRHVRTPKA